MRVPRSTRSEDFAEARDAAGLRAGEAAPGRAPPDFGFAADEAGDAEAEEVRPAATGTGFEGVWSGEGADAGVRVWRFIVRPFCGTNNDKSVIGPLRRRGHPV
jgi:hypothetical protein